MHFSGYLAPDEFWALMRETDSKLRESFLQAPVYGLAQWTGPKMVGEWAFGEGNRGFQYRHNDTEDPVVVVETGSADDPRWLMGIFKDRAEWVEGQGPGAALTPDRLVDADVDGSPVVFEVWDDPDRWCGVGVIRDRAILIESTERLDEPVRFERVRDVEPFLAGRNDWIRQARGE